MNLANPFRLLALVAAILLPFSPGLFAQAPAPGVPAVEPPVSHVKIPNPEQRKIQMLTIQNASMGEAVTQLLNAMKTAQIPELNVIYNPGAEAVSVPNLTLRNIRGADALQLIAASASCQVEAIPGEGGEIIGYRISPANIGFAPGADPFAPFPGLDQPPGVFTAPVAKSPPNPQAGARPTESATGGGAGSAGGDMVVGFGTAPAENVSAARVYPLGTLTTITKFNEVEETLREVFKAGGIPPTEVKLALHEKTNVLIVTGNQRVHEAVKQLLDALEKNTAAAEVASRRGDDVRREMIQMQVRLEAEKDERMRLMKHMEQSEAHRLELVQELERAKAAKPR
jgi:hypothetical protein